MLYCNVKQAKCGHTKSTSNGRADHNRRAKLTCNYSDFVLNGTPHTTLPTYKGTTLLDYCQYCKYCSYGLQRAQQTHGKPFTRPHDACHLRCVRGFTAQAEAHLNSPGQGGRGRGGGEGRRRGRTGLQVQPYSTKRTHECK